MKDQSKSKQELIEELGSLKRKVAEYKRMESLRRIAEKRLHAVNECLLSLGNDAVENIRRLTALTGELLGATVAIYNRLEGELLIALGQWQTPPDFKIKDLAQGHICYDVIRKNEERIIHIRNLAESPYAQSDPNVCAYGLATYVGHVVRDGSEPVGSLCVVFQQDFIPTANDARLMGIMAASIGTQEKRWHNGNALKESEATLRTLINVPTDSVFLLDTRGMILDMNNVAAERLGKNRDKLIGTLADNSLPEDIARRRRSLITQVLENGKTVRFQDKRADIWFDVVAYPVMDQDDKVGKIAIIARDITMHKQLEKALRESESKYRLMTENVADIIWTVDMNLNFTYISPSVQMVLGLTVEEAISQKIHGLLTPASLQYVLQLFEEENKTLMGNPDHINVRLIIKLEMYCKDGSTIWTENELKYLLGQDGKPVGIIGATRDISARILADEEKRSLAERLQRAEKMESLGTLAGGVAHDLNNVLGVVVGYSELLLHSTDESNPLRQNLFKIMRGGERAAAIVQDLLTLSKRGVPDRKVLNLNKIINDFKNSPEFEKLSSYNSSVQIKIDLEPDLLNVSGSFVHLRKTLFNLTANAVEAMPNGGILTIKTSNQYLDKHIQEYDEVREGEYVVLSVSDMGEGISAMDMKRIFEPFYTKKIMGKSGTGLGLAVVWGTVKDHDGYINVQSEEGKGSTFTLYFPVTRKGITSEVTAVPVSEYMGKRESILAVDDVQEQRDLAASVLTQLNYKVACVGSGEEAIAYLQEQNVDLLVLDMIMDPGIDGLETYIRALKINPRQKAIIVSGFSETERVIAAQKLGVGAYVKKPYLMEKLGLAVRKELDRN